LPTTTKGPIMAEVHTTFRAAGRTTSSLRESPAPIALGC
jgi:hypothetical protein